MTAAADAGMFKIEFGNGQSTNLDQIMARHRTISTKGGHVWVIAVVFTIDDPEQALDNMTLDDENFAGLGNILCLLCHEPYKTTNRHDECLQARPTSSPPAPAP